MKMKERTKTIIAIAVVIMLLPYVITIILTGTSNKNQNLLKGENKTMVDVKSNNIETKINLEEYIIGIVALQMPAVYEKEALKAQAVIVRTNLYVQKEKKETIIFEEAYLSLESMEKSLSEKEFEEQYQKLKQSVEETNGLVIEYQGNVVEAPYHAVCAGRTRSGEEAFQNADFEYLQGVDSPKDIKAKNYLRIITIEPKKLVDKLKAEYPEMEIQEENILEQMEILKRDSAGYVMQIKVGDLTISGEKFRSLLKINSSNFALAQAGNSIKITVKGLGHGVGLSQFGANEMAKEGLSYEEILNYYFQNIKINRKEEN
jgi:stage II sporulation protein D